MKLVKVRGRNEQGGAEQEWTMERRNRGKRNTENELMLNVKANVRERK
jgi:hypothetical protein